NSHSARIFTCTLDHITTYINYCNVYYLSIFTKSPFKIKVFHTRSCFSLCWFSDSFSNLYQISRLMGGDAITNQTLGGFIVLMLFLFLSNTVILFGALINTLIFELKNNISVPDYEMQVHE